MSFSLLNLYTYFFIFLFFLTLFSISFSLAQPERLLNPHAKTTSLDLAPKTSTTTLKLHQFCHPRPINFDTGNHLYLSLCYTHPNPPHKPATHHSLEFCRICVFKMQSNDKVVISYNYGIDIPLCAIINIPNISKFVNFESLTLILNDWVEITNRS